MDTLHRFTTANYEAMAERGILPENGIERDLYARAGIAEYWVVNLVDDRIVRFTHPSGGTYGEEETIEASTISPRALPDVAIDVRPVLKRFPGD